MKAINRKDHTLYGCVDIDNGWVGTGLIVVTSVADNRETWAYDNFTDFSSDWYVVQEDL